MGSIPGSERCPGEGNGNPLQYSCLGSPMGRWAWCTTVHEVTRVRHDLVTKEQHFIWYEACYSIFLLLSISMEYIFPSSHFQSMCVLRYEVVFLQTEDVSVHSANLCLLIGEFNPFTFKVIIDIYVPSVIFLIVWGWSHRSFLLLHFLTIYVPLTFVVKLVW